MQVVDTTASGVLHGVLHARGSGQSEAILCAVISPSGKSGTHECTRPYSSEEGKILCRRHGPSPLSKAAISPEDRSTQKVRTQCYPYSKKFTVSGSHVWATSVLRMLVIAPHFWFLTASWT